MDEEVYGVETLDTINHEAEGQDTGYRSTYEECGRITDSAIIM